jgi:hypothetical protein
MSKQKQIELLPAGFIACPDCNHDDQIQLVSVTTEVDSSVDPTGELPNVYVVSVLRCQRCDETFELPRVDVRFAFLSGQIVEIDFQNEFVVYTTLPVEKAIEKAAKWYNERFDYPLGEPIVRVIGNTIYTNDPRDITVPEEGE